MILVDWSSMAIGAVMAFPEDIKKGEPENKVADLIRHVTLTTLLGYKKKYTREFGDVVICCDARNYWRREVFPQYKASRKKHREDSDTNWELVGDLVSKMREDVRNYFPYKVILVDGAEADDVVGVLIKYLQENHLVQEGLIEAPQKNIIIASDGDYYQLHKHEGVKQFSPLLKKLVTESKFSIKEGLMTKIVKGDSGDGIPNIRSDDNVFVDKIRQKPIMQAVLDEFYQHGIIACKSDEEMKRFIRNRQLIDFDYIPEKISKAIIDAFETPKPKYERMNTYHYFQKNRCVKLIESIEEF